MAFFERHKSVIINQIDDNTLEVTAYMKDKFHEIKTHLVFDCISRQLTGAKAEMLTVPFDLCREVSVKMNELVGLELKKGVTRWVNEIVGTSRGCSHLVDLITDSVKALVQSAGVGLLPREMPFEEKLEKIQTLNMGICHTYSSLDRKPKYIGNRDF